jgi:AcrR family transcriptional regulator
VTALEVNKETNSQKSKDTRERILDIALELFIDQGYDKTSLREIAERLGFSKAAIYYHFSSKEDILMALHMRLHEFGKGALDALGQLQMTPELWATLLTSLIDKMVEQRSIFLLHERNQAAFEALHREDHSADHDDLQARFRGMLNDPRISLGGRVRMACALGAVMGGLVLAGEAFADTDAEILATLLRDAVTDLMAPSYRTE